MKLAHLHLLLLALTLSNAAFAVDEPYIVDNLNRTKVTLPDGTEATIVHVLGDKFRETTPEVIAQKNLVSNENVCFEAKFESIEKNVVKLLGQPGRVVINDLAKQRDLQKAIRGDNIWICGNLHPIGDNVPDAELTANDIIKLDGDLKRGEQLFGRYQNAKNAQGLLDLGDKLTKQAAIANMNDQAKFGTLIQNCYKEGLKLNEAKVANNDAEGWYRLGLQYETLTHNRAKRDFCIKKVLAIDPNHPMAAGIAINEMGLVHVDGKGWMTAAENQRYKEEQAEQIKQQQAIVEAARKERERLREVTQRDRPQMLAGFRLALRTDDPLKIDGAVASLAEAAQKTPDPEFGRQVLDLLSSMPNTSAITGLGAVAKNEEPEVRSDAYEALASRGGDLALQLLGNCLLEEAEGVPAKTGVAALIHRRDKAALEVLIKALPNKHQPAQREVVEGLRQLTKQTFNENAAWQKWWEANKNNPGVLPAP